jgi:hypothetical protein
MKIEAVFGPVVSPSHLCSSLSANLSAIAQRATEEALAAADM